MFDHNHRVALIAQVFQRAQQTVVVALVQADGWFIQHIEHPGQTAADLAGQPDALAFAARQRAAVAAQGQVFQPDVVQEPKPFADFLENGAGDLVFLRGEVCGHGFAPGKGLADRHFDHLACVQQFIGLVRRADLDRQRLGPQPITVAGAAGAVVLITLELFADPVAVRLAVASFHVGNDALERAGHRIDAPAFVIAKGDFFLARAEQEHLFDVVIQIFPLGLRVEFVMLCNGFDGLQEIGRLALAPGCQRAIVNLQVLIRHHQPFVKEQLNPQPVTVRAGPERRVEREQARLDLGDGEPADRAGKFLGKRHAFRVALGRGGFQNGDAIGQIKGRAQAVGQPRFQPFAHHNTVDDHVDVVAEFLVQRRRFVQIVEFPVNLHPLKALLAQLDEFLAVFAFAVTDDRRQKIGARALFHCHGAVHHVLHLLRLDGLAGRGAVGRADAGEQQPHIVVNLGHGAHGRTGVFRRGLLFDGNGRRQATDVIHVRFLHHVQELARIGRQRFHIAALPFGIDRVERERGFARP